MLASAADPELAEFLRLKTCPNCQYSLETLPPEGTCPECGRSYDQEFIIFSGIARGHHGSRFGRTWRGKTANVIAIIVLFWLVTTGPVSLSRNPNAIAWLIFGAAYIAFQLYSRLFSPHDPIPQLWIGRTGIAQVLSTAEGRQAQRAESFFRVFYLPIFGTLLMADLHHSLRLFAAIMIPIWLFAAAVAVRNWKSWGRIDATNYIPRVWPWSRIQTFAVSPLSHDRCRIRARITRYLWKISVDRPWIVDIEIPCPSGIFEKFRQWLALIAEDGQRGGRIRTEDRPK